ncbi:alpha/beta hydrolase [Chitiniphilus shinanonensis]|uniref:alpha/beta hydrolase n=1 Tax=Chitiniphilus shinanonensis TaxID=553088 RepID=UPI00306C3A10
MEQRNLLIDGIPAILWGAASDNLFIAVHGDQSNKADVVIRAFAEEAVAKGYQVLSFDLPEHGERVGEARQCNPKNCVEDLGKLMEYAHSRASVISLFGCSVGAYFGMLACKHEPIEKALFLSPVVDMKRLIHNMMGWFGVSEARLEKEKEIATPVKTLYWDYYQYVLEHHPIAWDKPTALLYGGNDNICELDDVKAFAGRVHAKMMIMEDGEHFFHTEKQLAFFRDWLRANIAA